MVKKCIILITIAHMFTESYPLFKDDGHFITFIDGRSHGVTMWWFIKGLSDAFLFFCYALSGYMLTHKYSKSLSGFFGILALYHFAGLLCFLYDFGVSKCP